MRLTTLCSYDNINNVGFNSTKEKSRLQNVMAFGCDLDDSTSRNQICQSKREEEEEEVDRFEEVVREIEERKEFLRDMAALGQDKPHRNRIMTEISQVQHQYVLLCSAM